MTLTEWIDTAVIRAGTRTAVYADLSRAVEEAGVPISSATIGTVDRGAKLRSYARAKALSEATGGKVTIAEICE